MEIIKQYFEYFNETINGIGIQVKYSANSYHKLLD